MLAYSRFSKDSNIFFTEIHGVVSEFHLKSKIWAKKLAATKPEENFLVAENKSANLEFL